MKDDREVRQVLLEAELKNDREVRQRHPETELKDDREVRQRLLGAGKSEFMEKDYMQASLRTICKKAGVTTGALYFFFQDKDDLFRQIVQAPLLEIRGIMKEHFRAEKDFLLYGISDDNNWQDDFLILTKIIHVIYRYKEEMLMVISRSKGSSLENAVDEFIGVAEVQGRLIADMQSKNQQSARLTDNMVHWMSHMLVDAFICMVNHIPTEEEAVELMKDVTKYMNAGWQGMFESHS